MTEKKVKAHLHRIWFHLDRLQSALNAAHFKGVIEYPDGDYDEHAPCYAMNMLRKRIRATTKDAIAKAVEAELRKGNVKW